MSNTKFTPGPWGALPTARANAGTKQLIATVATVADWVIGPQFSEDYQVSYENHGAEEADAQLISAAPDLYAALKDMLFAYQLFCGANCSSEPQVVRAAAALKKAEGGS